MTYFYDIFYTIKIADMIILYLDQVNQKRFMSMWGRSNLFDGEVEGLLWSCKSKNRPVISTKIRMVKTIIVMDLLQTSQTIIATTKNNKITAIR